MECSQFRKDGYVISRSVIDDKNRQFLLDYVVRTLGSIKGRQRAWPGPLGDDQVPGTPAAYGDFLMDTLLEFLRPAVEQLVGLELFPTYSYVRLYKHGDELKKHKDRPACEVSATLCLGYTPDDPWPIWIDNGAAVQVILRPGDMLVYLGQAIAHWRDSYPGDRLAQVFLHYVDSDGSNRDWKFDKRPALRLPASSRVTTTGEMPAASLVVHGTCGRPHGREQNRERFACISEDGSGRHL